VETYFVRGDPSRQMAGVRESALNLRDNEETCHQERPDSIVKKDDGSSDKHRESNKFVELACVSRLFTQRIRRGGPFED